MENQTYELYERFYKLSHALVIDREAGYKLLTWYERLLINQHRSYLLNLIADVLVKRLPMPDQLFVKVLLLTADVQIVDPTEINNP